jgi:hypothetical protein
MNPGHLHPFNLAAILIVIITSSVVAAQNNQYVSSVAAKLSTAQRNAAAEQEQWSKFWPAFRDAVRKRDRMALKRMISTPFDSGGGGDYSPSQWIKLMDEENFWPEIQKSLDTGTKPFPEYSRETKRPSRVTNRKHLIFVFGADGRWHWVAVMGD